MHVISSIDGMKAFSRQVREEGKTLALVPTMGSLHGGHLSLIRRAKQQCDAVIVSIFVNPTQFGPSEDLGRYPQNLEKDLGLLDPFNVEAVFTPRAEEIYPRGFTTFVDPGGIASLWEGASRPGHFRGVATVVLKLVNIVGPDFAYLGQKDFQQTVVLRQLVRDFNLNVRLVVCPTVRGPDGVALSSRNGYLSPEERKSARLLSRSLARAKELVWSGETDPARVQREMLQMFAADPNVRVDYVAIVDPVSFTAARRITTGCVALVAARVGAARLIDNVVLGPQDATEEQLLRTAQGATSAGSASVHAPGLEVESLRLQIQNCRACAAISSIVLPPREFLVKYLKSDYPDLNSVSILVIGRDAPLNPGRYLYTNPDLKDSFITKLYELLGVKDFREFTARFAVTDALRCHAVMTPVPEKALANCSRHLREELRIFPRLRTLVVLGEAATLQFQQFILGRDSKEIMPLKVLLRDRGWATEEVNLAPEGDHPLQVIYCYHPMGGYRASPSIAKLLS